MIRAFAVKWNMLWIGIQRLARCAWLTCLVGLAHGPLRADQALVPEARKEATAACQGKSPEELMAMMGDLRFVVRQCAQERLLQLMRDAPANAPNPIEHLGYRHFRTNPDPEIRMRALEILMEWATHHWSPVGYLGVASEQDSSFDDSGKLLSQVRITKVAANSPAAGAGVAAEDVVSGVDDLRFKEGKAKEQFAAYLANKGPGDLVVLHITRAKKQLDVRVVLVAKARPKQLDDDNQEIAPDPDKCLREYLNFQKNRPSP